MDFEDVPLITEMQKRFNYIEYEVDLLTNDLDKLEANKTMEALRDLNDKLSIIDSSVLSHMKHHQSEFDRMNKQIDGFITDSITFDDQLKMRMINIENAYRLFNITNDFQFGDLRSEINKVSGEQATINNRLGELAKVSASSY